MNTIINAAKFTADEKLEKFINEKVAKLDRMIDNAVRCEVTLKVDRPESHNNKIAELRLCVPCGCKKGAFFVPRWRFAKELARRCEKNFNMWYIENQRVVANV